MINTVLRGFLVVFGLLLILAAAWLVVTYYAWPLWMLLPTVLLGVLLWFGCRWLQRYWRSWRLRQGIQSAQKPMTTASFVSGFEVQWRTGMHVLRSGLLGRKKGSLYTLPWLLMLDAVPYEANDELAQITLQQTATPENRTGLSWWFLRTAVVLRFPVVVAGQSDEKTQAYWSFLLKKLFKTRRREPLNGVVFNINTQWLEQAGATELNQLGVSLRAQVDELNHLFSARIPCWVVLSQSQNLLELSQFVALLDPNQRQAFFGYFDESEQVNVAELIEQAINATQHRCLDLSLRFGQVGQTLPALALAQRLESFKGLLNAVFSPAFDNSPYAVDPLCKGVFWTAVAQPEGAAPWFTEQLYERLIPSQRHSWVAVDRLGPWRRLLQQAAVLTWFAACVGILFFLLYAARDVKRVIDTTAIRQSTVLDFSGHVESDLVALDTLHDITLELQRNTQGLFSYLPFRSQVGRLNHYYKSNFARLYQEEIRDGFMNGVLFEKLPNVIKQGSAQDLAAWTQYLVRRINLVQAQINKENLQTYPLIGPEMAYIYDGLKVHEGVQAGVLVGQLYPDYLRWHTEKTDLQNEVDSLKALLRQLNLAQRNIDWLLAWVDLQNDLMPVTLADFWPINPHDQGPVIPAGLTREGALAISAFIDELSRATEQKDVWVERQEALAQVFSEAAYNAWYRFVSDFDQGRQYLKTEANWNTVLSQSFTAEDPYLKLLRRLSYIFNEAPIATRPDWINTVIDLERLVQASAVLHSTEKGWLDQVRLANELGRVGFGVIREGVSVERSVDIVRDGATAVELFKAYELSVQEAVQELLMGQGSAMLLAQHTWGYGYDPSISASPLHQAQQYFVDLRTLMGRKNIRENAVWRLANGPLSFALEYAALHAACGLQKEWDTQVLSVIENVHSPILAHELLYGESGSVQSFMQGSLLSFVDRSKSLYSGRKALGLSVPLSGEFFAYLNTVQGQQTSGKVQRFEQEVATRQAQLALDQAQQKEKELAQQLTELGPFQAVVNIASVSPLLNEGAILNPSRTRLNVQCAQNNQLLENYNFPVQKVFEWDGALCGNTVLSFEFPNWTLTKNFTGALGFLQFLQRFEQGEAVFMASDFPEYKQLLQEANIEQIRLDWRAYGHETVLQQMQQRHLLQTQIQQVQQDLRRAQESKAGPEVLISSLVQTQDLIPERIAQQCWHRPLALYSPALDDIATRNMQQLALVEFEPEEIPVSTVESSIKQDSVGADTKSGWAVQVGVFANAIQATQALDTLGLSYQLHPLEHNQRSYQLVQVSGFKDKNEAQRVADKINQALKLTSRVVSAR